MSVRPRKKVGEMSFFDHLDELRATLFRAMGGVVVGLIVGYYFSARLQAFLLTPFTEQTDSSLAILAPTEGFIVQLKVALVAGLFISAPWIFYQLYRFIAPGLFTHERKLVWPVVISSSFLFILGAAFGMYILPMATSFFLSFAHQGVDNVWSLSKYIDFVLRMLLAFGVVFELPLLIYFLARFGVVTPAFLRAYRRHMYVVILIAAAILTPPDVFTQIVLSLPLIALYEVSILLAVVAKRKWDRGADEREERRATKEREEEEKAKQAVEAARKAAMAAETETAVESSEPDASATVNEPAPESGTEDADEGEQEMKGGEETP